MCSQAQPGHQPGFTLRQLEVHILEILMLRYRAQGFSGVLVAMVSLVAAALAATQVQVRQIRAGGVKLSYVEQGQGTPVVFVHGAQSDLRFWEPQRDAFAKQ